jgi:deoxyribose-phosphate aldolase
VPALPRGVVFRAEAGRLGDWIDHTLLRADATAAELDRLCSEAVTHRFAAVCVNPQWVPRCRETLGLRTNIAIAAVVGFPLGASTPGVKAAEAGAAVNHGAAELDMVASLGAIKDGDWEYVEQDIRAVVDAADGALVKVILESAILTPTELVRACRVARDAGAHYVKTSTGMHPAGGATPAAVALMRMAIGDDMGVKASGGVRDCAGAFALIESGATRIGTSGGVALADCVGPAPKPICELFGSWQ